MAGKIDPPISGNSIDTGSVTDSTLVGRDDNSQNINLTLNGNVIEKLIIVNRGASSPPTYPPELEDRRREADGLILEHLDSDNIDRIVRAKSARMRGLLAFFHDTEMALECCKEAANLDPENPITWHFLGQLYLRTGKTEEASRAHMKVLRIGEKLNDPNLIEAAKAALNKIDVERNKVRSSIASILSQRLTQLIPTRMRRYLIVKKGRREGGKAGRGKRFDEGGF